VNSTAFMVTLADWAVDGSALSALREDVFVLEQGVPREIEQDATDADRAVMVHAVARSTGGDVVGTGRLKLDLGEPRIGRMAVARDWRRRGVGSALLERLCVEAAERNYSAVVLHAQSHAAEFYCTQGFAIRGEEFYEAGIAHVEMFRPL